MRRFAGIGGLDGIPDETTILNFRRLLETHGLAAKLLAKVNAHLQRKGTFAFASTSPTDFDAKAALASIAKVLSLGEKTASPTHFGDVTEVATVAEQVQKFVEASEALVAREASRFDTLVEVTARIEADLRRLFDAHAKAVGLELDARDLHSLELDVTLNAQGLAFAAKKRHEGTAG